jgi:hypothetical protein
VLAGRFETRLHVRDFGALYGTTVLDGMTRRMLTTRKDGTITVNVTDEGKYRLSTQCLVDNKPQKVTNDLSWLFESIKSRR